MIAALAVLPLALPLASPTGLPGKSLSGDTLDHKALALAWLEEREVEANGLTVEDFYKSQFVHLNLGAFDLHFLPETFKEWSPAYLESLEGLVKLQQTWLGWVSTGGNVEKHAQASADLQVLAAWVDSLSKSDLKKAKFEAGSDFFDALSIDEETQKAVSGLSAYFATGGPVIREGTPRFVPLIFAPTRADFVTTLSIIGLADKDWRNVYWSPEIVTWSHCEWAGSRIMALQFASHDSERDFTSSTSMTQRNKRGIAHHVVQLGARTLFEELNVPSLFAVALANNMTIEIFGEVETRNDGDTSARKIDDVSVFIPGALSDGVLPPANADSRWRKDKGKDYFIPALRRGQKQGAKKGRSKWNKKTHFTLEGKEGGMHYVSAPFFGPGSDAPPADFLPDYAEFLRSYRAGFLFWLREHGIDNEEDEAASHLAFGNFLTLIASEQTDLGGAFEKVYPEPLSQAEITEKSLEGRFLAWLAKGK